MDDIKVYDLDSVGVIVDTDPINNPPSSLTKSQNAIADPIGEQGSIRKRPGLKPLNATAGAGSVVGGTGVPVTLGSAGPNFVNPFTDSSITLVPTSTFVFPTHFGPTFDDRSWWYDFDWLVDFSEPDDIAFTIPGDGQLNFSAEDGIPQDDLNQDLSDTFDISDLPDVPGQQSQVPSAPTIVPYNFIGTNSATGWYLSCDADLAQHVTFPTPFIGYTPSQPGLVYPSFGLRDYSNFLYSSINGGVNIQVHTRPAASLNNVIYYGIDSSYLLGTTPAIRAYAGTYDRLARQFRNSDGTAGKLVNNVLAANGKIYATCWLSGTTTANTAKGAVFEFDPEVNSSRQLGAVFATDQVPYSMCWAYDRLWVGTASNNSSAKVYWMRPSIDTDFTLDTTQAAGESVVSDLAIFQGQIYASVLNRTLAGSGKVYVRTTLGVWSTSDSGTIDGNGAHGNTRGYYSLAVWPAEDSGSSITSCLFATRIGMTEDNSTGGIALRRLSGGTWATQVSSGFGAILMPLFAVNSSTIKPVLTGQAGAVYQWSINGTSWTDSSANLTIVSKDAFPTIFQSVPGANGVSI